jgi:hypothetical protein
MAQAGRCPAVMPQKVTQNKARYVPGRIALVVIIVSSLFPLALLSSLSALLAEPILFGAAFLPSLLV